MRATAGASPDPANFGAWDGPEHYFTSFVRALAFLIRAAADLQWSACVAPAAQVSGRQYQSDHRKQ